VRDIIENETLPDRGDGEACPPTMVQFGGQTAINLSQSMDRVGLPILGSTAQSIDTASDRQLFEDFLARVGIPNPPGAAVASIEQGLSVADDIGYPVLVRPSYVLGGRAMEIVRNPTELIRFISDAFAAGEGRRVLIDKYFEGREVEVDAVCDGESVLIPGMMEHVERAGVHSGDSMAIYPGLTMTKEEVDTVVDYTTRIGLALQVRGLMNIQYVLLGGPAYRTPLSAGGTVKTEVYVIEVNPRSSRTIPFISKVTGVPMVRLAVNAMLGRSLAEQGYAGGLWEKQKVVGVKAPVFSMSKLAGVDTYLGPEMKSTGEVMGIAADFGTSFAKAQDAAGARLPVGGVVFLSVADPDKLEALEIARDLAALGFELAATRGTREVLAGAGLRAELVLKVREGSPDAADLMREGRIALVINTPSGKHERFDEVALRRAAIQYNVPYTTTMSGARAAVRGAAAMRGRATRVRSLQEYHRRPSPAGGT
jgi:carbamoyl-phosphate synthase large subunit